MKYTFTFHTDPQPTAQHWHYLWVKVDSKVHDNRISKQQTLFQASPSYLIHTTTPLGVHCIVIAAHKLTIKRECSGMYISL